MREESKHPKLIEVLTEIARFKQRVECLKAAEKGQPGTHPKELAAIRRTSMDLSRVLTAWRQRNTYVALPLRSE
jgi:hypothetical protein